MNTYKDLLIDFENKIINNNLDSDTILGIDKYFVTSDDLAEKEFAAEFIDNICEKYSIQYDIRVLFYSMVIRFCEKEKYILKIFNCIKKEPNYTWNNLYFLYGKLMRTIFMNKEFNTLEVALQMNSLFEKIIEKCIESLDFDFARIPEEELVGNCQLVITSQFLAAEHGPTKTALDRAVVIKKKYGNVLLVNTAEFMTDIGGVPFMSSECANYNEDFLNIESFSWKGTQIGFFQCEKNMPNNQDIIELLNTIKNIKPKIVVSIGGESLISCLVNKLVPTLVIGCTQSNLPNNLCDYLVADRHQIELNNDYIDIVGCRDKIIEGLFTFSLKERTEHICRKDIDIKDDEFVISMVGARLTDEINDELLTMFESISMDFKIVLIGSYDKMDYLHEKYPKLYAKTYNAGFCSDAMSRIELSDLYINPIRKGGGTSAVEAMSLGVPVVSFNYGDVAGIVGEDFICDDMETFRNTIIRYIEDKEFYSSQSYKARKLADVLLDSESEFARILEEYINRRK